MLHDHHAPPEPRDPAAERWNARWGLALFAAYAAGYGGFVLLAAIRPQEMAREFAGLNLATLWGLALIAGAFVVALLYAAGCRDPRGPAGSAPAGAPPELGLRELGE